MWPCAVEMLCGLDAGWRVSCLLKLPVTWREGEAALSTWAMRRIDFSGGCYKDYYRGYTLEINGSYACYFSYYTTTWIWIRHVILLYRDDHGFHGSSTELPLTGTSNPWNGKQGGAGLRAIYLPHCCLPVLSGMESLYTSPLFWCMYYHFKALGREIESHYRFVDIIFPSQGDDSRCSSFLVEWL